jgi:hypothetical protein
MYDSIKNDGVVPHHPNADPMEVAVYALKQTQGSWVSKVPDGEGDEFICENCEQEASFSAKWSNDLIISCEAVCAAVEYLLREGKDVDGYMALMACSSYNMAMPSTGKSNLRLLCGRVDSKCDNPYGIIHPNDIAIWSSNIQATT